MPSLVVGAVLVEHLGPELKPELPVLNPAAFGGHPFTGVDGGQRADHRHQIAVALGFDLEHGQTVFLVEERDPLDQPGKAFGELLVSAAGAKQRGLEAIGDKSVLTSNDAPAA